MRSKFFIILFLFILLLCVTLYPVLIDRVAIPDRTIDWSYQQFLLKASKPIKNKIIISSGSNSIHSIDARLMEKYFKRHVIVLADNAGYPLEHRIYNLSNYVSAGDLIIFPLEWTYFAESKKPPDNYVNGILDKTGSLSFYYRELPYLKKLDFIYNHVPFILALKRISIPNKFWRFNAMLSQNELYSINTIHSALNSQNRGARLINNPEDLPELRPNINTCDDSIFMISKTGGNFKVSGQFKNNLALLKKMTGETGAEVIFTWPTVVGKTGNECYTSAGIKDKINKYGQEIVAEVNRHGFKFIGNIEDSKFDSSCFLNTYYHIKADCAVERTRRLIDLLETNGVRPATGYSTQESEKILNDYLTRIELPFIDKLSPLPINVPIKFSYMSKKLIIANGWSVPEDWGIWSIGNSSTIIFPKVDKSVKSIGFSGIYFEGSEKTGVWINDWFAGNYDLSHIALTVAGRLSDDNYNKIVLQHSNPVASIAVSYNNDTRKIKYKLYSLEFMN